MTGAADLGAADLGAALRDRGYLWSRWPWLAGAHLLAGLAVLLPAVAVLAVVWLPWGIALVRLAESGPDAASVGLALLGAVTSVVCLPPLSALVAHGERRRALLVDPEPVVAPARRPVLRSVYASAATLRALAHLLVLLVAGTVVRAVLFVLGLAVAVAAVAPWIVGAGVGPLAFGFWQVGDMPGAIVLTLLSVPLLVGGTYLAGLAALGEARLARTLLGTTPEEVTRELTEVVRSRGRLVDAFDAERRRIERDLHDGAQQRLLTLTMRLGLARASVRPDSAGHRDVVDAHEMAKELMGELRDFVHNIHPQVLSDRGLPEALRRLVESGAVPVALRVDLEHRPAPHVESTLYFAVAEAYHNAVRHSGATRIDLEVDGSDGRIVVVVRDDGRGGADPGRGTGLTGIADRLAGVGGTLAVASPTGGPTVLRMEVPYP